MKKGQAMQPAPVVGNAWRSSQGIINFFRYVIRDPE